MAREAVPDAPPVALSTDFLRAVREGSPTDEFEAAIRDLDPDALAALDDGAKTAFWVNLYNAFVQRLLEDDPSLYADKRRFFGGDRLPVAGRTLSLDDVEHGILRGSRWKYGLGYLPRPFPGDFERRTRVGDPDPRVHFALNCGAASCPPIATYTAAEIDDELALATESYLSGTVDYDPERSVARVPRLFLWFRGDFGGKDGILALLRDHDLVPGDARPRLKHRSYDWSLSLGDYR